MTYFNYITQEAKACINMIIVMFIIHVSYLSQSKPEMVYDYKYWLTYVGWSLVGLIGALSIKWYYRNS